DAESEKHSLVETIAKAVPSHNLAGRDFRCKRRICRHLPGAITIPVRRVGNFAHCGVAMGQSDAPICGRGGNRSLRSRSVTPAISFTRGRVSCAVVAPNPLPNWSPIFRAAEGVAEQERVSWRGLTKICR